MVTPFNPLSLPASLDTGRAAALDAAATQGAVATGQPFAWLSPDALADAVAIDPSALPATADDVDAIAADVLQHLGS